METDDAFKTEPKSEPSSQTTTPAPTSSGSNVTPAAPTVPSAPTKTKLPSIVLPEVDLYLNLLVLLFAIDRKKYEKV